MSLSRINVLKYFLLFALSGILIYLVLNKSISGDETATFAIASMQYSDIFFQKYIGEFNPFGYFILNKFFIDIFEPSQTLLKIIVDHKYVNILMKSGIQSKYIIRMFSAVDNKRS